jgi:hypothetical protein
LFSFPGIRAEITSPFQGTPPTLFSSRAPSKNFSIPVSQFLWSTPRSSFTIFVKLLHSFCGTGFRQILRNTGVVLFRAILKELLEEGKLLEGLSGFTFTGSPPRSDPTKED